MFDLRYKEVFKLKKLSAVTVALFLVIISCFSGYAAGINAAEQSVLSNMRTPANMNGHKVYVPAAYINQAEAHFNTIDMTQQQADTINGIISQGRAFLEGTGKSNIKDLTSSQKQTLLSYASKAANVLKLTAVAGSDENRIKIITKDGTVIVDESNNIIKTTGYSSLLTPVLAGSALFIALVCASAGLIILKKRELVYEKN